MEPRSKSPRGLLWVAAGACLWGTDTLFRRTLTAHLNSITIVFLEHAVLAPVLLPVLWTRRLQLQKLRPRDWVAVAAIAWGGSALATVFFTEAVRVGNPSIAVLLQKSQPVFAGGLAGLLLSEPLGARFWMRMAGAIAAAYLISFGAALPQAGGVTGAALLALAAAALWGASTVLGRYVLGSVPPVVLTALRVTIALPLLAAIAWFRGSLPLPGIGAAQAVCLVLMALIPGLAGLVVYYRGLQNCLASRAAVAELCFPATAVLLNWLFFDARISLAQGSGFALLTIIILSWQSRGIVRDQGPKNDTRQIP